MQTLRMLLARGPRLRDRLAVEMLVAQTASAELRLLHGRMREGRGLGLRHDPFFVQRRASGKFKVWVIISRVSLMQVRTAALAQKLRRLDFNEVDLCRHLQAYRQLCRIVEPCGFSCHSISRL